MAFARRAGKRSEVNLVRGRAARCLSQMGLLAAGVALCVGTASGAPVLRTLDRSVVFDPATEVYSDISPLPTPLRLADAVTSGDKIYVVGGVTPDPAAPRSRSLHIYDPTLDSWSAGAPMPTGLGETRAVAHEGMIYTLGGHNMDVVQRYDIAQDTWTSLAPMPAPRGKPSAAVYDNKIYAFAGGYHGRQSNTWAYDIAQDTWQTRTNMPLATNHGVAGVIGDRIYVWGEETLEGGTANSFTLEYDPATDDWLRLSDSHYDATDAGGAILEGRLYKFGGRRNPWGDPTAMVASAEVLAVPSPGSGIWEVLPKLPWPKREAVAVAPADGKLYLFGGQGLVPEPTSLGLLIAGGLGLVARRRKHR